MKYYHLYKRQLAMVMMVLTAILAVDVIYQLQMHIRWRLWLAEPAATSPSGEASKTNNAANANAIKPVELSKSLTKRNIFMEPAPTGHGLTLAGVLGRLAIFNNRTGQTFSVEEGKSSNGVTVKSIHDYEVTFECQGKCETMKLAVGGSGPMMGLPPGAIPSRISPPLPAPGMKPPIAVLQPSVKNSPVPCPTNNTLPLNKDLKQCTTAP